MRRLLDGPLKLDGSTPRRHTVLVVATAVALMGGLALAQNAPPQEVPYRAFIEGKRAHLDGVIGKPGFRHRTRVLAVAFAPDGKHAFSSDADGVVHAWDLAAREETWAAVPPRRYLLAVTSAVVAAGPTVVASDEDHGALVLDAATGAVLHRLECGRLLAIAPDGTRGLASGAGGVVLVALPDGHAIRSLGKVNAAAAVIAPDGQSAVLVGGTDSAGTIARCDLETGAITWSETRVPARIAGASFSPDGQRLATWGAEPFVRVWELPAGKASVVLSDRAPLRAAVWTSKGSLVTANAEGNLEVQDLAAGKLVKTISTAHLGAALMASPDGTRALAIGDDATLHLLDLDHGRELGADPVLHAGSVTALAVTRTGGRVASAGTDGVLEISDVSGAARHASALGDPRAPGDPRALPAATTLGFTADARTFVASGLLLDAPTEVALVHASGRIRPLVGKAPAAIAGDGKSYVASTAADTLEVHDFKTERVSATLSSHGGKPRFVALSDNGDRVLEADEAGRLAVWSIKKSLTARLNEEGAPEITALAMTPDGKLALVGTRTTATLWDLEAQRRAGDLPLADAPVVAAALSPDGKLAAVACEDGTIRLWETTSRSVVDTLGSSASFDVARVLAFAGPRTLLAGTDRGVVLRFVISDGR